jgi:hypothetical protein
MAIRARVKPTWLISWRASDTDLNPVHGANSRLSRREPGARRGYERRRHRRMR